MGSSITKCRILQKVQVQVIYLEIKNKPMRNCFKPVVKILYQELGIWVKKKYLILVLDCLSDLFNFSGPVFLPIQWKDWTRSVVLERWQNVYMHVVCCFHLKMWHYPILIAHLNLAINPDPDLLEEIYAVSSISFFKFYSFIS